jgi:hypothetical protein
MHVSGRLRVADGSVNAGQPLFGGSMALVAVPQYAGGLGVLIARGKT